MSKKKLLTREIQIKNNNSRPHFINHRDKNKNQNKTSLAVE